MLTPAQIKTNLVQWKGAGMRAWDVQILQSSSGKARLRVWDHNKKFGQSSSQHMAVISLREKRLRHRGGQDCWTLSSVLAVYLAFFRPVIFIDNKFDAFFFLFLQQSQFASSKHSHFAGWISVLTPIVIVYTHGPEYSRLRARRGRLGGCVYTLYYSPHFDSSFL